ncbi:MAG: FtsW/RodA/SpoVE family cell cycle protein [Bacteroidales bacterium]|nr:FtsW/RodA/SpoVE family cell cycle protein [Bacteroidales bacterium]
MAGKKKNTVWNFFDRMEGDKVVWMIALLLILVSIVCIFSSTSRLLDAKLGETRVDMVRSQLITVAAGLAVIILCYNIRSIKFFRALSKYGFLVCLLLLVVLDLHVQIKDGHLLFLKAAVDNPDFGAASVNHAWRVIKCKGLQIHVFEMVKVAMVLYLAWAMDAYKKKELKSRLQPVWQRILYIYTPFLLTFLLVLPGSNGSALLGGGIMFFIILLGGGSLREMAILLAAGAVLLLSCWGIYEISGHKGMERIGTGISRIFNKTDHEGIFLSDTTSRDRRQKALDLLRQPYGAKIAVHEGGLVGKGPGQSTQRYLVPDMSEDYMYSFIVEEYGLLGGILVIFLYVSLLARSSIIVRNCKEDRYAKLTVAGLSLLITVQAFLHLFVNADIGPTTGQTLPLISHGRSAFLCFSLAFGIILSFSRTAARKMALEQKNAQPIVQASAGTSPKTPAAGEEMKNAIYDYDIQETAGNH